MKNILRLLFIVSTLFTSTNPLLAQWVQTKCPPTQNLNWPNVNALAVVGTSLFAGTASGIYISTNNGGSWIPSDSGMTFIGVTTFALFGTNLYAGIAYGGIDRSTDNGKSWTQVNAGLEALLNHSFVTYNSTANSFAVLGGNLFVGFNSGGVFRLTSSGTGWTPVNSGLGNASVNALAVLSGNLIAGTSNGVFLSTNSGTSWGQVNAGLSTDTSVNALAVLGTNLFAGTRNGVYLSTNNGVSWTHLNSTNYTVTALSVINANLFVGTSGGGIFLSTNNGTSWTQVGSGMTGGYVSAFIVSGTNFFAATLVNGVWRRPLSEMPLTSVEDRKNILPIKFSLEQNYPNPFNPTTTISFSLTSKSFVSLKIFDALGRQVAAIVSEELSAGNYSKQWNAANMPSGVYFYQLHTGTFTETKKLVLLR
jgi:hypothetical protein